MSYRPHPPPSPRLIGYDPVCDLPPDHLARLVEAVVEEALTVAPHPRVPGTCPYDPRLPIKVLIYGYATGTRSSRRLEQACAESLPYLFLTRGDTPSYRTLCRARLEHRDLLEQVWISLFAVAGRCGLKRVGKIVVDSTKLRADASPEAVLTPGEYSAVQAELARILEEARQVDEQEEQAGTPSATRLGASVEREQMRDLLRRVRKQLAQAKRAAAQAKREPTPRDGEGTVPEGGTAPDEPPAAAGAGSAGDGREGAQPRAEEKERVGAGEAPSPRSAPGADGVAQEGADAAAAPSPRHGARLSPRMQARVAAALAALAAAIAEERKHLCLTDPEARMMGEGRSRRVQECYSFEVAVDREAGLLLAGSVTQEASDNARLEPLVEAAGAHVPAGVQAVDADSGYCSGGAVGRLIRAGVDTCRYDPRPRAGERVLRV
jgi:hypothetical protein